jgi:hypothetical protein
VDVSVYLEAEAMKRLLLDGDLWGGKRVYKQVRATNEDIFS